MPRWRLASTCLPLGLQRGPERDVGAVAMQGGHHGSGTIGDVGEEGNGIRHFLGIGHVLEGRPSKINRAVVCEQVGKRSGGENRSRSEATPGPHLEFRRPRVPSTPPSAAQPKGERSSFY
ncbi:hypothetical protein BHE74_00021713 [Ensete ventricosum]|nr:hypothetical protein BHE74_00021713 [Ensete ventricosum]RZS24677.1 hypothetical protein BHM03_00057770 [Ensete ventricosum]